MIHKTLYIFIIHHSSCYINLPSTHIYLTYISVSPLSPRAEFKELKKELTGVLLNNEQESVRR